MSPPTDGRQIRLFQRQCQPGETVLPWPPRPSSALETVQSALSVTTPGTAAAAGCLPQPGLQPQPGSRSLLLSLLSLPLRPGGFTAVPPRPASRHQGLPLAAFLPRRPCSGLQRSGMAEAPNHATPGHRLACLVPDTFLPAGASTQMTLGSWRLPSPPPAAAPATSSASIAPPLQAKSAILCDTCCVCSAVLPSPHPVTLPTPPARGELVAPFCRSGQTSERWDPLAEQGQSRAPGPAP